MSLTVPHLGQAGLCGQVLVVDLPQQPSLVLLVHFFGDDEQQAPSAALPAPPFKPPLPPGKEIRSVSPCLCKKRLSLFHSRTHPEHNVRDPKTRAHTQVAYSANKPNGLVSLASSSKLSWFKHTRLKSQFRLRRSKLA